MDTSEELIKIASVMNKTTMSCLSDPFPSKLLLLSIETIHIMVYKTLLNIQVL